MSRISDSAKIAINQLETLHNRSLEPEEKNEVEIWLKGRALAQVVGFPGWEVAIEMLQSYAEKEIQDLIKTDPAEKEKILSYHAVAFAADGIFRRFTEDTKNFVEASRNTPNLVKTQLQFPLQAPPEV